MQVGRCTFYACLNMGTHFFYVRLSSGMLPDKFAITVCDQHRPERWERPFGAGMLAETASVPYGRDAGEAIES